MVIQYNTMFKELEPPQQILRINRPKPLIHTNYKIELNATYKYNKNTAIYLL